MTQVLLKVSEYLRKIETLERFLVGVGKQRDEKLLNGHWTLTLRALRFGISEGVTQ
jgi:hypothetical protein